MLIASANSWFTYYWWQDDRRAPDYARTVNIHAKPGYDPCELFLDPAIGQSVTRVFALSNIYKDVTPRSAQIMLGLWRDLAARANGSRHQTQLQDDARRARTTASQAAPQTASQVQPQPQAQSSAPAAKPASKLTVRLVPVLKKATSSGA